MNSHRSREAAVEEVVEAVAAVVVVEVVSQKYKAVLHLNEDIGRASDRTSATFSNGNEKLGPTWANFSNGNEKLGPKWANFAYGNENLGPK